MRIDHELDPELKEFVEGAIGVVEANSFEIHSLWEKYQRDWDDRSRMGLLVMVGELAGMPVCMSLSKAVVKGHTVLFMDATSQVVDHRQIDAWFAKHLPNVRRTDAMNFHIVFPREEVKVA